MKTFLKILLLYVFHILFVFLCILECICGRRVQFPEEGYYSGYYDGRQLQYAKVKSALEKLEHAPQWSPNWPDSSVKLGQVSGVALEGSGRVLVFHRASNTWDVSTFTERHVYTAIGEPPIPDPTVLVFNDTGELEDMWGQNLFFMPHGITVDSEGNVWVTDVALHQVFKFTPDQRQKPALVLGEKFVPGDDDLHFCKPSAVAVLSNGDFFVADGYCNTRIVKFASDGTKILQWGRRFGESPFVFNIPHALTVAEDRNLVCVADRERGRAACFRADNGTYAAAYSSWLLGARLFSLAYSPVHGGRLYVVNGPGSGVPVRGYVIDFESGRLLQTFAPDGDFSNPHDVVVTPDGSRVYVAELNPYKVHRFTDETLVNETRSEIRSNTTVPAKPTATVEVSSASGPSGGGAWEWWRGAAGGATAAAGAALLAAAAAALLRARNRGRKCVARRRWEYGRGEFKLRRLLDRRRFTRVRSDSEDDEPAPMLPHPPANA